MSGNITRSIPIYQYSINADYDPFIYTKSKYFGVVNSTSIDELGKMRVGSHLHQRSRHGIARNVQVSTTELNESSHTEVVK